MTDLRFTDPRRYLPFADPAHAPDWPSRDDPERPVWGGTDEKRFTDYCLRQLDELDRRARIWSAEETEMLPKLFEAVAKLDVRSLTGQERALAAMGIDWAEFEKRSRRAKAGQGGPGPTVADPAARASLPVALAAQDMAKLRFVIFPRFWGRQRLTRPRPEEIAARRQGCDASAAASWYENNRIAEEWRIKSS